MLQKNYISDKIPLPMAKAKQIAKACLYERMGYKLSRPNDFQFQNWPFHNFLSNSATLK